MHLNVLLLVQRVSKSAVRDDILIQDGCDPTRPVTMATGVANQGAGALFGCPLAPCPSQTNTITDQQMKCLSSSRRILDRLCTCVQMHYY